MDKCINEGKIPMFGYPLVCYSPIDENDINRKWGIIYHSAMNTQNSKNNIIG